MSSCDCFKIGGPFIAEDPDCPTHGYEAKERDGAQENLLDRLKAVEERLEQIEKCLKKETS